MNPMIEHLQMLLIRDLKAFVKEIESFPDDETLWSTIPGISNPAGNLALHVAGNLQYFVGALLGGSGYTRDRDLEFRRRSGSREEVIQELARALHAVETVIPQLTEQVLLREYPIAVDGKRYPTNVFLLRLNVHLTYHLGQVNYLRRALIHGRGVLRGNGLAS